MNSLLDQCDGLSSIERRVGHSDSGNSNCYANKVVVVEIEELIASTHAMHASRSSAKSQTLGHPLFWAKVPIAIVKSRS
jgi:hypothetical protein